MKIPWILLGRGIALSLHRFEMEYHRPVQLFGFGEQIFHCFDIVAIGRAQVSESHQIKDGMAQYHGTHPPLHRRDLGNGVLAPAVPAEAGFHPPLQIDILRLEPDFAQRLATAPTLGLMDISLSLYTTITGSPD